jgi:ATP phosphoribosyltransferase
VSEPIIKIGLPKGSLQEATLALFAKAGYRISVDERQYKPHFDDGEITGVLLRAQEMPNYVAHGELDCGLTGLDWILEQGVEDEVVEVTDLIYAKRGMRPYRWVLAVHESSDLAGPQDLQGKRVATELVAATRKYLARNGVEADVEYSWGATEAKCPGLVDAIVEGTETGSTLVANNLKIIDTLFESTTKLIANREAWENEAKRAKIESLALMLNAALAAENKVGLKMNVGPENLDAVLAELPAMKNPTVSPLADNGWVAVETIVDANTVFRLIPSLKAAGAEGIIEYPLNKVIP